MQFYDLNKCTLWCLVLVSLRPIKVYRIGFGVCSVLAFNIFFVTLLLLAFYFIMIVIAILGCLYPLLFLLNHGYKLSGTRYFSFACCSPPRMFVPLTFFQYNPRFLYIKFVFSITISFRGVPGFWTDDLCGVWNRGLTACLLHICPTFGDLVLQNSWSERLAWWMVLRCFCVCYCIYWNISKFFAI